MDGDAAVPTEVPNSPHMGSTLAETDADVHALARKELGPIQEKWRRPTPFALLPPRI